MTLIVIDIVKTIEKHRLRTVVSPYGLPAAPTLSQLRGVFICVTSPGIEDPTSSPFSYSLLCCVPLWDLLCCLLYSHWVCSSCRFCFQGKPFFHIFWNFLWGLEDLLCFLRDAVTFRLFFPFLAILSSSFIYSGLGKVAFEKLNILPDLFLFQNHHFYKSKFKKLDLLLSILCIFSFWCQSPDCSLDVREVNRVIGNTKIEYLGSCQQVFYNYFIFVCRVEGSSSYFRLPEIFNT